MVVKGRSTMKKKIYINNVYMVLTLSFVLLLLPTIYFFIRRIDSVMASEIITLVIILSATIYCLIQSIEYMQLTESHLIYRSLYEKQTFARSEISVELLGKKVKRTMAGEPYLLQISNGQTGTVLAQIEMYCFSKQYKSVIAYLKSGNVAVSTRDEVLSKR